MCLQYKSSENTVGRGEIARNEQFLHFRQCFLYLWTTFHHLTLSQTKNSRQFQTEKICRRQSQIWWKWQTLLQMGRKHCWKRRNYSLQAISPFPSFFQKTCTADTNQGLLSANTFSLEESKVCHLGKALRMEQKMIGKIENDGYLPAFSPSRKLFSKCYGFFFLHDCYLFTK